MKRLSIRCYEGDAVQVQLEALRRRRTEIDRLIAFLVYLERDQTRIAGSITLPQGWGTAMDET